MFHEKLAAAAGWSPTISNFVARITLISSYSVHNINCMLPEFVVPSVGACSWLSVGVIGWRSEQSQ